MEPIKIQRFETWRSSDNPDMEAILGSSRQFSHLAGVNLEPKGRWKKEGSASVAKFSVRPKPLKWNGAAGWERISVVIRNEAGNSSFAIMIDGNPISLGPSLKWLPIRKAAHAIERAYSRLKKEDNDDSRERA